MGRPTLDAEVDRYEAEFVAPNGLEPSYHFRCVEMVTGPRVLDLGAGFTSIWLRECGFSVTSADHDPAFLALIRQYAVDRGLTNGRWLTLADWRAQRPGQYDTVIVDHGPDTQMRLRDLPQIMAAATGDVFFDDARGHWVIPLRKILTRAGFRHETVWSRSGENARSVVRAWRQ